MCLSEYDLICDECRKIFNEIYETEAKTIREERLQFVKFLNALCNQCKHTLKQEYT